MQVSYLVAQRPAHTHFINAANILLSIAAIVRCAATLCLPLTCADGHRCCQSNNSGEEGEAHFLCEVIRNLLRGISNDMSEDEGNTIGRRPAFKPCILMWAQLIWQSCYCTANISVKPAGAYSIDYDHVIICRYWDPGGIIHDM